MISFTHEIKKVANKLIMTYTNVYVMILSQDKTKGHFNLSTKQLKTKLSDMLHFQAY
jgi:hypothetical protein